MARILTNCPDCGQEIQIDDRWKNSRCRHCGVEFEIEQEDGNQPFSRQAAAPVVPPAGFQNKPTNTAASFSRKAAAPAGPRAGVQREAADAVPENTEQPQTKKPATPSKGEAILVIVVCLVVVIFVFGKVFREVKPKSPSKSASPAPAAPAEPISMVKRSSGSRWVGCADRAYFEKLLQYAVQGDEQAYVEALGSGLLAGTCTKFVDGETVYLCDVTILGGLVKVRREGELQEYWTNREAVK